ncbi:MAG: proteasome-type protease [Betaproteobacteria bacterium]|jgi:putative proteasome-type protease|nr:proteasome-type protease [Betaproteobacteria bacterium]
MTYCVAVTLNAGMVFASDSRTNAGVDHVSSFRKMKVFSRDGDRVIVILCSGNLSITQSAINLLDEDRREPGSKRSLYDANSMYEVAEMVGQAVREVRQRDALYLQQANVDAGASFIVGGQIAGGRMRLFQIYSEGNFIEATPETVYFQIGESKYGKPVIDRVVKPQTSLLEATKCLMVSFDSTIRSNISVGLPIDLLIYRADTLRVAFQHRILETDPYFNMVHQQWGEGLRKVFTELPNPDWNVGFEQ